MKNMKVMKSGTGTAVRHFVFMNFLHFMVRFSVPSQPRPYRGPYRIHVASVIFLVLAHREIRNSEIPEAITDPMRRIPLKDDISNHLEAAEAAYREIVSCPFCSSDLYEPLTAPRNSDYRGGLAPVFAQMRFQFVGCTSCGLTYQRNRPRAEYLGQYYTTNEYPCYESLLQDRGPLVRMAAVRGAKKVVADIEQLRPKHSPLVVDFGCGSGSWLELFQHVGVPWKLMGTEISAELCQRVEPLGVATVVTDHDSFDTHFAAGSVDAFFLNHVIEHLPHPLRFLQKAHRVLTEGGIVYGQTPNRQCWEARLFKEFWTQWHLPHHLVIFEPTTLAVHAQAAGFTLERWQPSVSGVTQWSQSLLCWLASKRQRRFLNTRDPLYPALTAAFLPVALLQARFGATSHMDFVLRKVAKSP